MKKAEIKVGGHYAAKVSGKHTTVRVDSIGLGGLARRQVTTYVVTNLTTGRKLTFRSAAKFRREVKPDATTAKPASGKTRLSIPGYYSPAQLAAIEKAVEVTPEQSTAIDRELSQGGYAERSRQTKCPTCNAIHTEGACPFCWAVGVNSVLSDSASLAESVEGDEQRSDPSTPTTSVPTAGKTMRNVGVQTPSSEGEQRPDPTAANGAAGIAGKALAGEPALTVATDDLEGEQYPDPTLLAFLPEPCKPPTTPEQPIPETVGLAGDQPAAFHNITERIGAGQQVTKLVGFAGAGKTWLLARITQWARRSGYKVVVAAPTHKAAAVISGKLGVGIEVRTIHSLLGLKLEPDWTNDTGGRILTSGEKRPPELPGLVICDEASMVGSVLKEHIDARHDTRWLFVGDLAQLPPVGESASELLSEPDSTLSVVLRQAQDSEILNLATTIRNGDLSMSFAPGQDVTRLSSADELFDAARARFESAKYRADPSHARILLFRNDRRRAVNDRMRALVIGREEPYVEGEWLVMYAAFSPEKSRLNVLTDRAKKAGPKGSYEYRTAWRRFFEFKESLPSAVQQLHVSEEVRVESATLGCLEIAGYDFAVWRLRIEAKDGRKHELPVIVGEEAKNLREIKDGYAAEAQATRKERDDFAAGSPEWAAADRRRKEAWSTYFLLEETFAQVDYAYAMTVHKSQGSTFDHAFVDVPDLLSAGEMMSKILYTAVTRPAKSLTFYL